jgi:hypothetical protein
MFQRQGCNDAERTALGLNTNGSVKAAVGNKFSGSTGFEQHDQVKVSLKRSLCCFTFWYWEIDDLVNNLPQRQQGNKSPISELEKLQVVYN